VLQLFQLKVEGLLAFGRWLWSADRAALSLLDAAYQNWARAFLKAGQWRSWAVCFAELGWTLSGSAKAILDIALQRHLFWSQHPHTLASHVFAAAHLWPGETWAKCSEALMQECFFSDCRTWVAADNSATGFRTHVRRQLLDSCAVAWQDAVSHHTRPMSITCVSTDISDAFRAQHSFDTLLRQRSLCCLRAGLLSLGHLNFRISRAAAQQCILCNKMTRSPFTHVMLYCERTSEHRTTLAARGIDVDSTQFLRLPPSHAGFSDVVNFAHYVHNASSSFWKGRSAN